MSLLQMLTQSEGKGWTHDDVIVGRGLNDGCTTRFTPIVVQAYTTPVLGLL